jgi:hypothetical protein
MQVRLLLRAALSTIPAIFNVTKTLPASGKTNARFAERHELQEKPGCPLNGNSVNRNFSLAPSGKSGVYRVLAQLKETSLMRPRFGSSSDIVEISRLNGDFRRNYGKFLGALLYLYSISIARNRPLGAGLISPICAVASAWFAGDG